MGQPIVIAFGALAAIGVILLGVGLVRRARIMVVVGTAVLLAVAGAWVLGLPGVAVGLLALAFLNRGSTPS